MFFVLVITVVFVLISVYFFFRAEKLQREIITQQRESLATRKENKILSEYMILVATREEEFAKAKLQRLKAYAKANDHEQLMIHAELISPLINNYSIIFRECLKGKGRLKAISQKCFENQDSSAYKKFVALIVTSDKKLKRYWSSDNLNGFLFLVDALLTMTDDSANVPIKNQKSNCLS
ncbi:hypothetical protein [Colwellia sp. 12G3]|uniref:hypothetical protein n=1 Tax=Colwellia sp. 12G3 TaxID=2058299 RepID=UPI000C31BE0F|nr:hypothetical protein [Colwellia sp. 12G3]PKI12999.1 hypothetical protein CXF71_20035 [Colwellia sp. 12G3]